MPEGTPINFKKDQNTPDSFNVRITHLPQREDEDVIEIEGSIKRMNEELEKDEVYKKYGKKFIKEEIEMVLKRYEEEFPEQGKDKYMIQSIHRKEKKVFPKGGKYGRVVLDRLFSLYSDKKQFTKLLEGVSPEKQKFYKNIPVHSLSSRLRIILDKISFGDDISRVVKKSRENGNPIEKLVYLGSSDDLETAMLSGVSQIILVDPVLHEFQIRQNIFERVVRDYDIDAKFDGDLMRFSFEGRIFTVMFSSLSLEDFVETGAKADLVMLFNPAPGMADEEAMKVVREGGLFFDNMSGFKRA